MQQVTVQKLHSAKQHSHTGAEQPGRTRSLMVPITANGQNSGAWKHRSQGDQRLDPNTCTLECWYTSPYHCHNRVQHSRRTAEHGQVPNTYPKVLVLCWGIWAQLQRAATGAGGHSCPSARAGWLPPTTCWSYVEKSVSFLKNVISLFLNVIY